MFWMALKISYPKLNICPLQQQQWIKHQTNNDTNHSYLSPTTPPAKQNWQPQTTSSTSDILYTNFAYRHHQGHQPQLRRFRFNPNILAISFTIKYILTNIKGILGYIKSTTTSTMVPLSPTCSLTSVLSFIIVILYIVISSGTASDRLQPLCHL